MKESPEVLKARWRRWYEANKEYRRAYIKKNRARYTLHARNWRIRNKGSSKLTTAYRESYYKRQKIMLTIVGQHSGDEWRRLKAMHGYMCHGCGDIEPNIILTKDHIIPLSKNGTDYISNIQPLCVSCNSRKHNRIVDDLWNMFLASQ